MDLRVGKTKAMLIRRLGLRLRTAGASIDGAWLLPVAQLMSSHHLVLMRGLAPWLLADQPRTDLCRSWVIPGAALRLL